MYIKYVYREQVKLIVRLITMVIYAIAQTYISMEIEFFYLLNKNYYEYATLGILSIYSCMLYAVDAILDL